MKAAVFTTEGSDVSLTGFVRFCHGDQKQFVLHLFLMIHVSVLEYIFFRKASIRLKYPITPSPPPPFFNFLILLFALTLQYYVHYLQYNRATELITLLAVQDKFFTIHCTYYK